MCYYSEETGSEMKLSSSLFSRLEAFAKVVLVVLKFSLAIDINILSISVTKWVK